MEENNGAQLGEAQEAGCRSALLLALDALVLFCV
jgi:hypothetical protein